MVDVLASHYHKSELPWRARNLPRKALEAKEMILGTQPQAKSAKNRTPRKFRKPGCRLPRILLGGLVAKKNTRPRKIPTAKGIGFLAIIGSQEKLFAWRSMAAKERLWTIFL